jgi:hypothetical protein
MLDEGDSIKSKELMDSTQKLVLRAYRFDSKISLDHKVNIEMISFGEGIIFLGQGIKRDT